ncbi:hypothetical protein [Photobacterium damselae]|uniref:hypothetical protein n=1 Tax=Photobacterium damselae TaxID=38293 RepID=UPI001EDFF6E6|nr:hypothetical protein [Photobacterium damselae]MCG3823461.1 hypothetical protein [Photobacterium damselae]
MNNTINDAPVIEKTPYCPVCGSSNTTFADGDSNWSYKCLDCSSNDVEIECDKHPSAQYLRAEDQSELVMKFDSLCKGLFDDFRNNRCINPVQLTELKVFRVIYERILDKVIDSRRWLNLTINTATFSLQSDSVYDVQYNAVFDYVYQGIIATLANDLEHEYLNPVTISEAKLFIVKYQDYFDYDLEVLLNDVINKRLNKNYKESGEVINLTEIRKQMSPEPVERLVDNEHIKNDSDRIDIATVEARFHKRIFIMCNFNPVVVFFFYFLSLILVQLTCAVVEKTFFGAPFHNVFDPLQFVAVLVLYIRTVKALSDYLLIQAEHFSIQHN